MIQLDTTKLLEHKITWRPMVMCCTISTFNFFFYILFCHDDVVNSCMEGGTFEMFCFWYVLNVSNMSKRHFSIIWKATFLTLREAVEAEFPAARWRQRSTLITGIKGQTLPAAKSCLWWVFPSWNVMNGLFYVYWQNTKRIKTNGARGVLYMCM